MQINEVATAMLIKGFCGAEAQPERSQDGTGVNHAAWMLQQIEEGEVCGQKAHRWLGYAQAILVTSHYVDLEDCKRINHEN